MATDGHSCLCCEILHCVNMPWSLDCSLVRGQLHCFLVCGCYKQPWTGLQVHVCSFSCSHSIKWNYWATGDVCFNFPRKRQWFAQCLLPPACIMHGVWELPVPLYDFSPAEKTLSSDRHDQVLQTWCLRQQQQIQSSQLWLL